MAFDLTLSNPVFNTVGNFGQSLKGGYGYVPSANLASQPITGWPLTLTAWVKANASGNIEVAAGRPAQGWVGKNANNTAVAHYGSTPDVELLSTVNIADGNWHYLELVVSGSGSTATGGKFFVDGTLQSSSTTSSGFPTNNQYFGIRAFFLTSNSGAGTYTFLGEVDEVGLYNTELHSASYTAPTAAAVGNEAGQVGLWRLNGDGTNSAGTAAPGDMTAPSFLSAQVANSSPNVIQVTMSEALAASVPPASAFAPSGGRAATAVSINGSVVSVTVDTPYTAADAVTIAYTRPSANPRLQDAAANLTATFAAQAVTNNIIPNAYDASKILFSPANWDIQASYAKTINSGAGFKMIFGGASCTLNFDMTGVAAVVPKISYRVDEFGPWNTVDLAASIVIAVPSDTTGYSSHYLELFVRSTSEASPRWAGGGIKLTGVVLATGKTLSLPGALDGDGWFYGDSITEGINTLKSTGDTTVRSDAGQGWAMLAARALGVEAGIIGFGRQGLITTGNPDVPVFTSTYNMLYSGVARSFAKPPKFIVINQGTNDGSGNILSAATTVLNGLLAAVPATTKIIVLRPFNGSGAAYWQSAIAACSAPWRVRYIDTTGWFATANSPDGVHPNGFENATHIAPLIVAAVRAALNETPTLNTRAVSVTMGEKDTSGNVVPAANLDNVEVSFYDEATPGDHSVARFKTKTETTDANGVMSFTVQSTLPVGGQGSIAVKMPDGRNMFRTVQVA